MAQNIIRARYNSITDLLCSLQKSNNKIMNGHNSSQSGSSTFALTKSYKQASDLLMHGFDEPVENIRREVQKNRKMIQHYVKPRRKEHNLPVGYLPNVPNAILGLPNAMIGCESNLEKKKTLAVAYANSASCGVNAKDIAKAGSALVSAISIIELNGIQTELYVDFFCATSREDKTSAMLKVKGFGERFNIRKLAFPMTHPSMFRRIGFKFLETTEGLKDSGWAFGYGRPMKLSEIKSSNVCGDDVVPINYEKIAQLGYDIKKIVDYLTIDENTESKKDAKGDLYPFF